MGILMMLITFGIVIAAYRFMGRDVASRSSHG
jgi:hypothetical protein